VQRDNVFIHPTSLVSDEAHIGESSKIWQFCTVMAQARIGRNSMLSQNVYMEGGAIIGDNVKVKNNICLYAGIVVDDDAFLGPCAVFTNVLTPRSHWPRKDEFLGTAIGKGATIGAGSIIVCGVSIGRYALTGAGSVVTRAVPDFSLVYGNPARHKGWVCHCGRKLSPGKAGETACGHCGSLYSLADGQLRDIILNPYKPTRR